MPAVGAVGLALVLALVAAVVPSGGAELGTLGQEAAKSESPLLRPKVMIAILARNAAHSLPYYLGCIDRLDYPKERIAIWGPHVNPISEGMKEARWATCELRFS
ncbi:unnamed protein product [Arctogadus glacialis]